MKKQPIEPRTKRLNRFPKAWNEKKVRDLINHYDNQSGDAAYSNPAFTMMAVPVELVPAVQKLIAKKAG